MSSDIKNTSESTLRSQIYDYTMFLVIGYGAMCLITFLAFRDYPPNQPHIKSQNQEVQKNFRLWEVIKFLLSKRIYNYAVLSSFFGYGTLVASGPILTEMVAAFNIGQVKFPQ